MFYFCLQLKSRTFHELESFFSLKGPNLWYYEFAITLPITGEKAASYGHYVTDITLQTLHHELR